MHPQGSQVRWVVLAGALAALPWLPARGDEGGTPFWLSGQYAENKYESKKPGQQIVVRLNSGVLVAVTQAENPGLRVGQRVFVEGSGSSAMVVAR